LFSAVNFLKCVIIKVLFYLLLLRHWHFTR